jgi:ABC-2 type transport system ATP-binding protein
MSAVGAAAAVRASVAAGPPAVAPIETSGLEVRYGRRQVLSGISLTVPKGSVTALLGRNGTGKSSLIRCLLGEQKATAGTVRLFGRDVWRERTSLLPRVGVVPEQPDAPPELPARRLAAFCASLYERFDHQAFAARLDRFGVDDRQPFGRLSKGQKGAVMLALALGHSPELLVLDDPTLGLDVVARHEVFREVIGDLADRGTTVFLTTHDLEGVEAVADRVAILKDGVLAVQEDLEPLKARYGRPLEEIFTAIAVGGPAEKGAVR